MTLWISNRPTKRDIACLCLT